MVETGVIELPTTLEELLDDVEQFVSRFVLFGSDHQSVAVALWVVHVYAIGAASTTPYLRVSSAAPESGKSRLLEVAALLLGEDRCLTAVSLPPATVFRAREHAPVALLIDEADSLAARKDDVSRELLAIVNGGYRRGAPALRAVPQGKGFATRSFPVFGPTILAGLGKLADTTESRCVPILLRRKPASSSVEDFMWQLVQPEAAPLRSSLEAWASDDVIARLSQARPDLEELRARGLRDRVREVWWPLVAIADLAGGAWPARARAAAVALHEARGESDTSDQMLLLEHIRAAFDEARTDRLPTRELLRNLVANEVGPWGRWWGAEVERELAPRAAATDLARKLGPFDVRPRRIRLGDGSTVRGYLRDDFETTWGTYLRPDVTPATTATTATPLASGVASVASVASLGGIGADGGLLDQAPSASNGEAPCPECRARAGHTIRCPRLRVR